MLLKLTITLIVALLVLNVSALQEAGDTKAEFRLIKHAAAQKSNLTQPKENASFLLHHPIPFELNYDITTVYAIDVELLSEHKSIPLAVQMAGDHTGAISTTFSTPYFAENSIKYRNVTLRVTEWSLPSHNTAPKKKSSTIDRKIVCRNFSGKIHA
ncbi:BQ5605_C005g03232 [Microbotryum silenes-dioicae]|uniref:BQ5605_C005g03232 protein n=1 Tax=Microbotryum silenes-dioicae TaxID=796604 RepID=A0A2X0MA74_9BASI|nr:BQ5605_C005g03232 [Microbotryum silenes-dioicae]